MTSEIQSKLEYAKSLKLHLATLGRLVGRGVSPADLMDLESTRQLRKQIASQPRTPSRAARVPFSALRTEHFGTFVRNLAASTPEPVHVWIDTTAACGVLALGSLLDFNFAFDFEDEPSGIIVIRTADLADRILLDFSEHEDGLSLDLEWSGPHWSTIELPPLE